MITEEAIEMVFDTVREACAVDVVTASMDPYRYWLSNRRNGELKEYAVPVHFKREAMTIESFVAQLAALHADLPDGPFDVYVDRNMIHSVTHEMRRESLTMGLVPSRAMKWLSDQVDVNTPRPLDQRGLLRVLKTILPPHEELINSVRSIKLTVRDDGESDLKHGKESVGRAIAKQLADCQIPEEVTFELPVLDRPDGLATVPIKCLVDVDLSEDAPAFSIIPLAGEIERVWRETLAQIVDLINHHADSINFSNYSVFMGSVSVR